MTSDSAKENEQHMCRTEKLLSNVVNPLFASPSALRERAHFRLLAETMPDWITLVERKDIQ